MRPLNSDELGEKGEARFRELCADAKLICNKSDRDRTGWDFIVEFPTDIPTRELSLDKRGPWISCYVQVKTIWASGKRVSMRLSSAERLAKALKPAFVFVLVAGDNKQFQQSHLIHITGANLARILKRLREAHAAGDLTVNRKEITFDPVTGGVCLALIGTALRDQLVLECGSELQTYIANKAAELKTLGFDTRPLSLKIDFSPSSIDELVEVFLGLRSVAASKFDTFETRFGITLPQSQLAEGAKAVFQIQPNAADRCIIRVHTKSPAPPAVFAGEIFVPGIPKLADQHFRVLIRTEFFTLDIRGGDKLELSFDADSIALGRFGIAAWSGYLRLLTTFSEGKAVFDIEPRANGPRFSIRVPIRLNDGQAVDAAALLKTCENAAALLQWAGATGGETSLQELIDVSHVIDASHDLFIGIAKALPLTFETPISTASDAPAEYKILFVSYVRIAGVNIAFGVVAVMTPTQESERLIWRPAAIEPVRAAVVDHEMSTYRAFIADLQAATGITDIASRHVEDASSN